jgi:two-component system, OmpR family, KDP operon response regulator KdpE
VAMARVLLIDEDMAMLHQLQPALAKEGYRLDHALPDLDAIRSVLLSEPDIVILGVDCRPTGWSFCQRLLEFLERPLLLLVSTNNPLDLVKGLELGADDCMAKPVHLAEAAARVRSLLRRSASGRPKGSRGYFVDGDLIVDLKRREVRRNGQPVGWTPTEFRLLSCFISYEGSVLSHEQLTRHAWGPQYVTSHGAVKLYVCQLRSKIEPDPRHPQRIQTRRGEGYLFSRLSDMRAGDQR